MATRHRQGAPTVHVHIVPLSLPKHETDACRRLIDDAERWRADRFRKSTDASRWIVGRARLRQVLADHLDIAPEDISFREGRNGKPVLREPWHEMHFNLSHSHGLALVAVSDAAEVGVDLEYERELPTWPSVARRVFTPEELEQIEEAQPDRRQHLFYRGWTRKEAIIKATGEGLSADLKKIAVSVRRDARLLAYPDGDTASWTIHNVEPAPGYVGALAMRSPAAPHVIVHRGETFIRFGGRAVA